MDVSCWILWLRSSKIIDKFPYYYVDAFKEKISPIFSLGAEFPQALYFPEIKVCLFPYYEADFFQGIN